MSMTDPVADLLTRIRNAQRVRKERVSMPSSKLKIAIVQVLQREGFVSAYALEDQESKPTLTVKLKYFQNEPVIEELKRISRPGRRIYKSKSKLPVVRGGLGVAIVSTSAGVLTDKEARAQGHGGEVICTVY